MKTIQMTSKILLVLTLSLFVFSCKENNTKNDTAESQTLAFKNDLSQKVYDQYQQIKNSIATGNTTDTQEAARELSATISNNYIEISKISKALVQTSELEQQKAKFAELTNHIEDYFAANIAEGVLYKQFCPMALNDKGAYWFSKTEAIENPYFEGGMLKCGSVEGKLE